VCPQIILRILETAIRSRLHYPAKESLRQLKEGPENFDIYIAAVIQSHEDAGGEYLQETVKLKSFRDGENPRGVSATWEVCLI
jgi:hypothetical protein